MFDKDAIQELSKAQAIAAARDSMLNAHANTEDLVALPEEFKVHDLEQYMLMRRRARGTMTTQALGDFGAYVKTHAEAGATIFVSPESMNARAVLNLGTKEVPGHADNRAEFAPPKLAAYLALLKIHISTLNQQDAAEFLEDWIGQWQGFHDSDQLTPAATIAAVRNVKIEELRRAETSVGQLSAERSAFDQIKASSGANKLPTHIYFKCVPFLGFEERTYVLRLAVRTGGANTVPTLTLRIVNNEAHAEALGQELATKVRAEIGEALPVHLGSYSAK